MAKYKNQKNIIMLTAICLLLGLMIMLSINTHRSVQVQQESNNQDIANYIKEMEAENALLEEQIQATRQQIEYLESGQEEDQSYISELNNTYNRLNINAQLTALEGPGIIITLDDNKADAEYAKKNTPSTYRPENYIVHDYNLRYLLRAIAAEAEAVSINNVRITDTTSIRCVGATILVDGNLLAAPYTIRAIGEKEALASALEASNAYKNIVYKKLPISYEKVDLISLSPYGKGYTPAYTMLLEDAPASTAEEAN